MTCEEFQKKVVEQRILGKTQEFTLEALSIYLTHSVECSECNQWFEKLKKMGEIRASQALL